MLKGDRDKVTDALSSTLAASDMKHIKVDNNFIQLIPKGPKLSVDKIPLADPDFKESDEWKTTLASVQYFLKKISDEIRSQQEREHLENKKPNHDNTKKTKQEQQTDDVDGTLNATQSEKTKKQQRKRRSKKPVEQGEVEVEEEQHVPSTNTQEHDQVASPSNQVVSSSSSAAAASSGGIKSKKNNSNSKKRSKKSAVEDSMIGQVPPVTIKSDPVMTAVSDTSTTKPSSSPGTSSKKKRSKKIASDPSPESPNTTPQQATTEPVQTSGVTNDATGAVVHHKPNSEGTEKSLKSKKRRSKRNNASDAVTSVEEEEEEEVVVPSKQKSGGGGSGESKPKEKKKNVDRQVPSEDPEQVVDNQAVASQVVPPPSKRKAKRRLGKPEAQKNALPSQVLESDVLDYSELEDVLTQPLSTKQQHPPNVPFFAPDKKSNVSNATSHNKDAHDRISNRNKPSKKNKHAEVPPPKSLTVSSVSTRKTDTQIKVIKKSTTTGKKRSLRLSPTERLIKSLRSDLSLDTNETTEKMVMSKLDRLLMDPNNKAYFDEIDMMVGKGGRRLFPPYLKPELIPYLVEQKILLQGYIRISRKNAKEAWVVVDESDTDAFIYGTTHRNRAMDGDRVVIIPVDSEKVWERKLADKLNKAKERKGKKTVSSPTDTITTAAVAGETTKDVEPDSKNKEEANGADEEEEEVVVVDDGNLDDSYEDIEEDIASDEIHEEVAEGVEEDDIAEEEEEEEVEVAAPPALCGRVVYIYPTKEKKEYPGTVVLNRNGKPLTEDLSRLPGVVWFKPINKRVPLVMLKSASLISFYEKKKLDPTGNHILKAKMQYWSPNHATPLGNLSGYIGQEDTLPVQCKSILLDSNIIDEPFNAKVLGSIQDSPRDKSSSRRKDFRDKRVFTIDPATARDLDDALHVEKIAEDEYEVGVHIADVSHFVNPNTLLDGSAFNRGTSVYLCDRVIPMFPFQLSEEKCSLNPNEDRLTFSVIWKMDGQGNVKSTEFTESTIRSCAKLAYDDAQSVIETDKLPKELVLEEGVDREGIEQDIRYLAKLARNMRQRRFDTGSLSINSIKLSFELDEEGKPIGVSIYQQKEANKVIEEFMLLANRSVAHKLHEVYPEEALLRQHGPPKEKALDKFLKTAENLGYPLDGSSAGALQASLNLIKSEHVKQVLEIMAAKPMQRAKYFCAGTPNVAKFHHYALNIPLYTHFTSPIRRFADVVVHRQLKAALSKKASSGYSREKVENIVHQCNEKKESAKNVEDDTKRVYLAYYLNMLEKKNGAPIQCTGIVTSLDKEAIEVLVPSYGIEKRIYMDALPLSRFVYNPRNISLNAYWKPGTEVNMEWVELRKTMALEDLAPGGELYKDKSISVTPELIGEATLDKNTSMQRFSVLGEIEVRLETDVERSPPTTYVFPVNPF